jgi:FAD/FMN-containing dehydrogenase
MLVGVRLVTGEGEIKEFSIEKEPDLFRSLRVALGTHGIFTQMRLQLQPCYKLQRQELYAKTEDALNDLDRLIESNRNFDFYWYPRSDCVKLRIMNESPHEKVEVHYAKTDKEMHGWSHEILARERNIKFDEMEYSLPAEKAVDCFLKIRERVKKVHRKYVGWRILVRTVAADDNYLSTVYKRETITISLHHNAGLEFWNYFLDIEPIFLAHDGRPHWGKKHTRKHHHLEPLYPEWEKFMTTRVHLDPQNVFVTEYIDQLLGINK